MKFTETFARGGVLFCFRFQWPRSGLFKAPWEILLRLRWREWVGVSGDEDGVREHWGELQWVWFPRPRKFTLHVNIVMTLVLVRLVKDWKTLVHSSSTGPTLPLACFNVSKCDGATLFSKQRCNLCVELDQLTWLGPVFIILFPTFFSEQVIENIMSVGGSLEWGGYIPV